MELAITGMGQDERGVSDALGYILLLAVVVTSISATVFFAGPVIEDQQQGEYNSNTVRAFEVFSENLESIERERSPSRATEMRFQGGTLFEESDVFMQVNVTKDGVTNTSIVAGTPVTYRNDNFAVHYEMGSVIRDDNGEYVMRKEPPFTFSDDRTRMSVVTTTITDDEMRLARSGKVVIISKATGTTTRFFKQGDNPDDIEVNITLTTPRYEVWLDYFKDRGMTVENVDHANNEIEVSFTTKEFMLRESIITVEARQ